MVELSTQEMAPHAMNMVTFGSRAVLMVRTSLGRCPACNDHSVDVINVSGHRLSTAEIESALIMHKGVAETAVIGTADELTGQAVFAFVTLKPSVFCPFVECRLTSNTPGNSRTTTMTRLPWLRSSYSKSGK